MASRGISADVDKIPKIYSTRDCVTARVTTIDPRTGETISETETTCFINFIFEYPVLIQVPWRSPGGWGAWAEHACSQYDLDADGFIDCFKNVVTGEPSSAYPLGDSRDWGPRPNLSGEIDFHDGIDVSAPEGSIIRAAQEGRVLEVGFNQYNGNYIRIHHADGSESVYIHMRDRPSVSTGRLVLAGSRIGYVGQTGGARGVHLHFTIWGSTDPTSHCEGCSYDPEAAFDWDC